MFNESQQLSFFDSRNENETYYKYKQSQMKLQVIFVEDFKKWIGVNGV